MNFEKISFKQYENDVNNHCDVPKQYEDIKLPKRATMGSAGYDFFAPFGFELRAGECITIPTGIRVLLDNDKFLAVYPRSGHGFKYKIQLANTVGIIDSDYSDSDNEGHIFIKLFNDNREDKSLMINKGDAIAQGIIQRYYRTDDDLTERVRNGGFGSTDW